MLIHRRGTEDVEGAQGITAASVILCDVSAFSVPLR
jgi:hypothetical protein